MQSLKTPAAAEPTLLVAVRTCPLCHTIDTGATADSLEPGGGWTCATCGQAWSARRLEAVAAYAEYVAAH